MKYTVATPTKEQHEAFLATHPESNLLQSPEWAEAYRLINDTPVIRLYSDDKNKPTGLALGIVKSARRGRYLEIPGGPLLDYTNTSLRKFVFADLVAIAREHKCVFIRLRPQLQSTPNNLKILQSLGARPALMHLHAENTVILDLARSEDELLAQMRQQTRQQVKKAQKLNIKVATTTEQSAYDSFYKLQSATAARQKFILPPKSFLLAERSAFAEKAHLYTASTSEDELLSMALVVHSGLEVDFLEAASTPENHKLPGTYALLWQAILDAKAAGLERFNLWGIAPEGAKNHRFAGVTTFKTGFGGEIVNFTPAHDIIISKPRYTLNLTIETIRKKLRRL